MIKYLYFSILIFFLAHTKGISQSAYRFDLEDKSAPTQAAYTKLTPEDLYQESLGYGWITSPEQSYHHTTSPLIDDLLRDGVRHETPFSFQIDAPNGEYYLKIAAGNGDADTCRVQIKINGTQLDDTVMAPFFRLPYRHFKRKISVQNSPLVIEFIPLSPKAGIHSLELLPVTEPVTIPGLDPQNLETDTAIVARYHRELGIRLDENPGDVSLQQQNELLKIYLKAVYFYDIGWWSWAVEETGLSIFDRFHAASDWLEQFLAHPDHPLHDRSVYLMGRIHYWLYKEQGDERNTVRADRFLQMLQSKYPDHDILAMYTGKKIPYQIDQERDTSDAPTWAILQQEAISRMIHIIHWWVDSVQTENGELGGKYGDDVEILRWWLPVVLGADDDKARLGYQRLADGVWNSGKLEQGYSKKLEDVEHAAELIRDSHPVMLILRYGDPEYVERCMIGMQHLEPLWTGITPRGNRHFRSAYFSSTNMLTEPPYGVDVPMNARATLTGLWATWYNHNPQLLRLFKEWGYAWADAAARTDKDKPKWIFPSAVRFDNDELGGYSDNWYHPNLGWDYYQWEHIGGSEEMYYQMLGMFHITGDSMLLSPYMKMLDLTHRYFKQNHQSAGEMGSESWAVHHLLSEPDLLGYALNLGLYDHTDMIEAMGSPYTQFLIRQKLESINQGLAYVLSSLRYNLPLFTTEVKFTDRVYVPGHDLLSGMYTGHVGSGFEFPFLHVSWENTGKDVGILVGKCDDEKVTVTLHNFLDQKTIGMHVWRLKNGLYQVKLRNGKDQTIVSTFTQDIQERGQLIEFDLPEKGTYEITVELLEPRENNLFPRGDLALGKIVHKKNHDEVDVYVDLHNIGNQSVEDVKIELIADGEIFAEQYVDSIEAPNDLKPVKQAISFRGLSPNQIRKPMFVQVSTQKAKEITYLNNRKVVDLSEHTGEAELNH